MSFEAFRSTLKLCATVCLIGLLNVTLAAAQSDKDQRGSSRRSVSSDAAKPVPSFAFVNPAITAAASESGQQTGANAQPSGNVGPAAPSTTASTPLTSGQKFKYFARSSFMPPTPYALSVLSGVFSEATDNDHGRHMTAGDFMADSMTHAARSFAFRATANFFEKYAFASAFRQDPRYFRSDKKGFGRISYAVSRVFITQSDSGHDQFNASFSAGGLVAAGISNAWARPEDRTVSSTMGRFGLHVGYRALSNILREFFSKK
jgi:hypothetical protein